MACETGDCLRSAYYGVAAYGCSYYGLIMPLSPPALTFGNQGAIVNTYSNQGTITLGYEETQGSGG